MTSRILIERTAPTFASYRPFLTRNGYKLVHRAIPLPDRHLLSKAVFVTTLQEAATMIDQGYAISMAKPGSSQGRYICPESLKITKL